MWSRLKDLNQNFKDIKYIKKNLKNVKNNTEDVNIFFRSNFIVKYI